MSTSERLSRSGGTTAKTGDSTSTRPHLVFITHSSKDAWIAEQFAQKIKECGAETFIDVERIRVGDDFEAKIKSHIRKAKELVALLTPWSIKSLYIWSEIGGAWVNHVPLIIVLYGISIEDLRADPTIPIYIKRHDLIELNDFDRYLLQLKNRLSARQADRLETI